MLGWQVDYELKLVGPWSCAHGHVDTDVDSEKPATIDSAVRKVSAVLHIVSWSHPPFHEITRRKAVFSITKRDSVTTRNRYLDVDK